MIKGIIFDLDGVLIDPRYFSNKFETEFSIKKENINLFFQSDFQKCLVGELDTKIAIKPFADKWGWKGSMEELLNYWFEYCARIDQVLLNEIRILKNKGYKIFAATNQDSYRMKYIKETMDLEKEFDAMYFSNMIGESKRSPIFFKKVLSKIDQIYSINKDELIYFDDQQKHLNSAIEIGIDSHIYKYKNIPPILFKL